MKSVHRPVLYRSRQTAAGRLRDIEAEIASLLRSFPDLPARPLVRVHPGRRRRSGVPVVVTRVHQKVH